MKPLSQQLSELSGRVKKTEDTVAAVREKNRAVLESQRAELTQSIEAGKAKASEQADAAKGQVKGGWVELRQSVERRFAEMRADADERRKERDMKKAERRADDAERDAADAIDLAAYFLDEAEYAVVDATLARADADALAQGG
jgi:hypothetical protein